MNNEVKNTIKRIKVDVDNWSGCSCTDDNIYNYIEKLEAENQQLQQKVNQLEKILNKVREKIKLERKVSLSLEQAYTIYVLDQLQNILNKIESENKLLYEEEKIYLDIIDGFNDKIVKLETNWDELKEWLEEIQQEEFDINGFTGVCTEIRIECILDKIEEIERGKE